MNSPLPGETVRMDGWAGTRVRMIIGEQKYRNVPFFGRETMLKNRNIINKI